MLASFFEALSTARLLKFPEEVMKAAKFAVTAFALCLFSLSPSQLIAQQFYGTITGTVTDPTGAVVPNANVKVTNTDTNVTSSLKTNGAAYGPSLAANIRGVGADPGFDAAAKDAIIQWKFRGASFDGHSVPSTAYVIFGFAPPVVGAPINAAPGTSPIPPPAPQLPLPPGN